MKKRILVSLIWSIGFPIVGLLIWMIVFCALDLLGVSHDAHHPGARFLHEIIVKVYPWSMCASPVIGLALGVAGVLPGTRHREVRPAWTGRGIEASDLKPRLEEVRRDHLAARQAARDICFHRRLVRFARRVVVQLGYFRHREAEEHVHDHGP